MFHLERLRTVSPRRMVLTVTAIAADQNSNDRPGSDHVCTPGSTVAAEHGDGANQGPGDVASGGHDDGRSGSGDGGSDN
jgi:hypothetical protein